MAVNNKEKYNKRRAPIKAVVAACVALGFVLLGGYLWMEYQEPSEPLPVIDPVPVPPHELELESELEPPPQPVYPVGEVGTFTTPQRTEYQDGMLQLYVPRMNFQGPVLNGVDDGTLKQGVGLFDQAQLPHPEPGYNSNTSIAGHRDLYGFEFYYIHWMLPGDRIYLTYDGYLYTYEVEDIYVTDPYNWVAIETKDHAVVTLQSCTPIHKDTRRIFVVGKLTDVEKGGQFPQPSAEEMMEPETLYEPEFVPRR